MPPEEAYISNWFYVPRDKISDIDSVKKTLTVWPDVSMEENQEPKPIKIYSEDVKGYLGLPVDWGIKAFDSLEFEDRTTTGSGDLIAPKRPDPYHPIYGSQEQADFMEGLLESLENNYAVSAKAPTGSGKTVCALNTAAELGLKTLVIVHLDRLGDQWRLEAKTHLGLTDNQIGKIQQGVCQYTRQFCVATVQTLTSRKYADDFYSSFGLVIFDETHKYGSERFSKVIGMFNPTYRLTLSATPNRKDDSTRILKYSFGPVRVHSSAESLPIDLYPHFLSTDKDIKTYNRNALINRLTSSVPRNNFIVSRIKKRYDENRDCLVISERVEHLELLYRLCAASGIPEGDLGLFVGQKTVNGKRKKINTKELDYVKANSPIIFATYGMMTEGINIPRLSWGIDTIPRANADQFTQLKGRIARPKEGKPQPIWETLVDLDSSECVGYYYSRIKKCAQENTTIRNTEKPVKL